MKKSPSSCSSSSTCIEPIGNKRSRASNNSDSAAKKSSIYRGVTRHRWSGRYEAHLWDKNFLNSNKNKKGKQVYLGAFDCEEAAARTYDLAALKYWGPKATLNFPVEAYSKELEEMHKLSREEFLASLRRQSSGFSRGVSKYRGVARHHLNGRWEARIGLVFGSKYLYLGTYGTQEEAAAAYDMAAIELKGPNAVTNFDISNYGDKLREIQERGKTLQKLAKPESSTDIQSGDQSDPSNQEIEEHVEQDSMQQTNTEPFVGVQSDEPLLAKEQNDHPWNLCLGVGFETFHVSNISLEEKHPSLDFFNDSSFDDEIDLVFGKRLKGSEGKQDEIFGNMFTGDEFEAKTEKGQGVTASTSPVSATSSDLLN